MPPVPTPSQLVWYVLAFVAMTTGTFLYHWIKGETVKEKLDRIGQEIAADREQTKSLNRKMERVERHITATPSPIADDPVTRTDFKR